MKKILLFILLTFLTCLFTGCQASKGTVSQTLQPAATEPILTATTLEPTITEPETTDKTQEIYEFRQSTIEKYNENGFFNAFTGSAFIDENNNSCLKLTDETGEIEIVSDLIAKTVITYKGNSLEIDNGFWGEMISGAWIYSKDLNNDGIKEILLANIDTSMGFTSVPCYIIDLQKMEYTIFKPDTDVSQLTDMSWADETELAAKGIDKSALILSQTCKIAYNADSDIVYAIAVAAIEASPEITGEIVAEIYLQIIYENGTYGIGDIIEVNYRG